MLWGMVEIMTALQMSIDKVAFFGEQLVQTRAILTGGQHMVTSKQIGLIILGLLVVGLVLCWVPKIEVFGWDQFLHPQTISPVFYKRDVFTQEDRARQTLATILGGIAVLIGAYLTWRNMQIAEDKQLTDRFTAAVTNLSAEDKMTQRLGGIYALERIAYDSPRDHWTVMEVLTAYIRDNRPKDKAQGKEVEERKLPTDINEVLRVILRRKVGQDYDAEQNKSRNLDIYDVDLIGAFLVGAKLKGAVMGTTLLAEARLERADLRNTHLEGANLAGAHLEEADLREANLRITNLCHTDLKGAKLEKAILGGAMMADCWNLTQRQLNSADQKEAPKTLPAGLTFPGYFAPDPPPAPSA